ncbi:MAG: hypothetical protein H0X02_08310 [Nitrosomonas sp.]|nr:hypothetical protein [Nitrosomonas sp.]
MTQPPRYLDQISKAANEMDHVFKAEGFLAGVRWARKNPSPIVMAVKDCLEQGLNLKMFMPKGSTEKWATEALANFEREIKDA